MKDQLTCIIVDDEPLAREGVTMMLEHAPYLKATGEFNNAIKAHQYILDNEVDLIFLDIEMPGLSGLEFIKSLATDTMVILMTAYPQYALEAFELDVLDYLVKPIKLNRFLKAVGKAKELHDLRSSTHDFDKSESDHIYIRSDRKYIRLDYNDIDFIKGLKDYVVINCCKKKYMTSLNIKSIRAQLPEQIFCRVSKSYIINVDKINSIDHDQIHVCGEVIPLGNSYKEDFLNRYVKNRLVKR